MTAASPSDIQIKHPYSVAISGILPHVPRAWQELLDDGNIDDATLPINLHQSVITAHVEEAFVGFLTYTRHPSYGFTWIDMSYVLPEHRRIGVYSKMFNSLVELERSNTASPVRSINSGINPKNFPQLAAARRTGRTCSAYTYEYKL